MGVARGSIHRLRRLEKAKKLFGDGRTVRQVAESLGVSESTVHNYKKELGLTKEQGLIRFCTFDGCDRAHTARGFCNTHLTQLYRHGTMKPIVTDESLEGRFWRQVEKRDKEECWNWKGPETGKFAVRGKQGYGQVYFDNKKYMAHRLSYELYHGVDLNTNVTLDHLCRNKMCVNPHHLEPVTLRDNIKRMHAYHDMASEIQRLRQMVIDLGGDPGADFPTL